MIELPEGFTWAEVLNAGEPLNLNREKDGDEWIDFVFRRLAESCGSTGYQMAAHNRPPGGYIYRPSTTRLRTALWVLFTVDKGLVCIVLGSEPRGEDGIELWRDAVTHGLRRIGTVTDFEWWAIVGPDPHFLYGAALRLSAAADVGGIRLDPAPQMFAENVPSRFIMFSAKVSYSGLVKVRGSSSGHIWAVAAEGAARRLRLLCAMLSLASGGAWVQRTSVNPLSRVNHAGQSEAVNGDEIKMPHSNPWDRDDPSFLLEEGVQLNEFSVPGWIASRWDDILRETSLRDALINYHEGLLMMSSHPSYAALAFVAVVEALGNRAVKKLPRCAECKLILGSGKRFRDALARVIPVEEAESLGRKFYDRRSRTAHDGILHGTEPIFGALSYWGGISSHPTREFERLLHQLFVVAHRLLLVDVAHVDVEKSSLS